MEIDWSAIGDFCRNIISMSGAWVVLLGLALFFIKYFKQSWVFIKDMALAPLRVKSMMEELKHNGGSSIKDALVRIENRQISNEQKLIHVLDSIENTGSFESNLEGKCTKVSVGYCHLIGRNETEILGTGWVNHVYHEDQEMVWKYWRQSIENTRYFVLNYRMVKDDKPFEVFCKAYPLISPKNQILGWFGIIKKI